VWRSNCFMVWPTRCCSMPLEPSSIWIKFTTFLFSLLLLTLTYAVSSCFGASSFHAISNTINGFRSVALILVCFMTDSSMPWFSWLVRRS
jgi:hypothetical protein